MNQRVLIIGGSLSGLMAGNLFHRRGWDVQVFERAAGNLEGRGAGITILPGLVSSFQAAGTDETEESLGIMLRERIALDKSGNVVAEHAFLQAMTSWGRLYESLRNIFPAQNYHEGSTLERVEQDAHEVTAVLRDGQRITGDLLIGADGLRSVVRSQFLPDLTPHYAGYVAWRCLTDESALDTKTFARLMACYTVCVAPGQQGIAYPVPGPGHSKKPGQRQYNVVWYFPVPAGDELRRLMTDDDGRHHPNGIPPALLSKKVRDEVVENAQQVLAPQFAEAIRCARMHFFQPIMDIEPPQLTFGRVAIVGDAAFATRPHVAMGVPKGTGDVLALAQSVDECSDLQQALERFESQRLRIGRNIVARGRYLGTYMEAQLGTDAQREAAEQARVPMKVMRETAAPFDYG
jgi:2-polyprenyl-6-methoxyphenol hydroxylase-like FAD-dependent oxidoreductase